MDFSKLEKSTSPSPEIQPSIYVPERNLLCAMIARASADLKSQDFIVRRSARNWLFSDEDHIWSFCWICGHLELDYRTVRKTIFPEKKT